MAGETIKTPGSESNVKEIFDKCWELRRSGQDLVIFNQFEEFGNYLWHYEVTGRAMMEVLGEVMGAGDRFRATVSNTGSGGTIACGDYMKEQFPAQQNRGQRSAAMPHLAQQRLWRAPHRRHWRQARALDSQRQEHRHRHGH